MTAFTVLLAPSGVHADPLTFKVQKVQTTDASGKNPAPKNDLRLGDKIRIVVRANTADGGRPRITAISSLNTIWVGGLAENAIEIPLVHPTGSGFVDIDLIDVVDDDGNDNTGDLVYGYTIKATDRITTGLSISTTENVVNVPTRIKDQSNNSALNGGVTLASGVVADLAAIRADGSLVRPPPATDDEPPVTVDEPVETPRRRIIYQCPVGWVRSTVFGNAKKAMIYEVKVDVDLTNRVSIYKLKSIAIYVHPDEGLETLDGWSLATGILYNHDHENKFQLTAENAVIDEHGFAHIQNPEATPIRMGTLGFIGQSLPSFDYRLYDDKGVRVDFGISCYKEGGLTWRLWNTKDPRVVRMLPLVESEAGLQGMLKDLNWNAFFYRSEWTVPMMPDLPAAPLAPSKPKVNVVGTWAALKSQKN